MEAERLGVPLLAQVPIDIALREGGDKGVPINARENGGPAADALNQAALAVARRLELL
ncbi:MAG: hypothetical protein JWM33_3945 [Caulobacteraceae bacterium]|nr:hypothetical protein [Caulobacteraceae bacterium]